jgi:hypothetical protein
LHPLKSSAFSRRTFSPTIAPCVPGRLSDNICLGLPVVLSVEVLRCGGPS